MNISILGPTHPYKGGIALHTTELAKHLTAAGNDVEIVSWRKQYPFFYPGVQTVPDGKPEVEPFEPTFRKLRWNNPFGWLTAALHMRKFDQVILVWWVPVIQGPVYAFMMHFLRGGNSPKITILAHNVKSHGPGNGGLGAKLTQLVFSKADEILVHTKAVAETARNYADTPVVVAEMPNHFPGNPDPSQHLSGTQNHLLFFGLVREYKGVDVLIKALAEVPSIHLTVAGEMWGKQQEKLTTLISELGLTDRIELKPGYVPAEDMNSLFAAVDALVLPYRSGTASQNVELAHAFGVPVIATRAGNLAEHVNDGADGLLAEPDNVDDLAKTISKFYEKDMPEKLRIGAKASDKADQIWDDYVKACIA